MLALLDMVTFLAAIIVLIHIMGIQIVLNVPAIWMVQ